MTRITSWFCDSCEEGEGRAVVCCDHPEGDETRDFCGTCCDAGGCDCPDDCGCHEVGA